MNREQSRKEEAGEPGENSLSRSGNTPQPTHDNPGPGTLADAGDRFPAHVVLYQPEIPQNTGNIGRTCVAVGAKLWIVRPAGFQIDDTKLRRAGLDYWQHLQLGEAMNWDDLLAQLGGRRMFFFSRFATRTIWEAEFQPEDVFVFGRETSGLPASILDPHDPRALRLPMSEQVRSLNLATTVGIVLYEHQRQTRSSLDIRTR
jgi:tRNA (cytidine/uridine-2'-O-)-methyltransferase